jgi:hypothetical protein
MRRSASKMATRYKITLQSNKFVVGAGYENYAFTVCTCLDERKAIVMAACAFKEDHPEERVYQVVSVERLEGGKALSTDIVDRLEY